MEVRRIGLAEQDDDDGMDASCVWEDCEKLRQPFCQDVLTLIWTNGMCGDVWNGVCDEVWIGIMDGPMARQGLCDASWNPSQVEMWEEWVVSKSLEG